MTCVLPHPHARLLLSILQKLSDVARKHPPVQAHILLSRPLRQPLLLAILSSSLLPFMLLYGLSAVALQPILVIPRWDPLLSAVWMHGAASFPA